MNLYWREPLLLWLVLLSVAFVAIASFKQRNRMAQIADTALLPWLEPRLQSSRWLNSLLLTTLWTLIVLALAGPRTPLFIPNDLSETEDRVVIVLDHSDSMQTRDAVGPQGLVSRITFASQLAGSWLDPEEPIVETGLLAFSGNAHWLIKPTVDRNLIEHFLAQSDQLLLPTLGSNMVDALTAIRSLPIEPGTETHIVLLTDGDLHPDKQQRLEAELLSLQAFMPMTLHLVGVGGTEPSPVPGHPTATTRMESASLNALASLHQDFSYSTAQPLRGQPLMEWLNIQSRRITPENYARVVWNEWFSIPLLLAILVLLVLLHRSKTRRSDG